MNALSHEPGEPAPASSRSRIREIAIALREFVACIALALVLYAPCMDGGFVSDDIRFIQDNARNLERIGEPWCFFTEPDTNSSPPDRDIYRPLRTLSFAVDHSLFGGSPRVFHLHNIILHAVAAFLLWRLLRGAARTAFAAEFGAALFLVHPLASEAVAWISSRSDLEAAVAVLLSLLVARRAEEPEHRGSLFAAFFCGLACGFAKEIAVVVPALYLIDVHLRSPDRAALPLAPAATAVGGRNWIGPFLALASGAAAWLAIYLVVHDRGIQGQVDWYGGSIATHLPYALLGIGRHLWLLVWPSRLNFMHEAYLYDPRDAAALLLAALALIVTLAVALGTRRKVPAIGCGLAFYAVALLPAANLVLPLRTVLAERFAYVPLLGFAIAVAGIATAVRGSLLRSKIVSIVAASCLLIPLALATWTRAMAFASPRALYDATLASWPESYSAALGLGDVAVNEGDFPRAEAMLTRAVLLARDDAGLRIRASYALGRAQLLSRNFERASSTLRLVVGAFDRDPALAAALPKIDAGARAALGNALALWPRLDEAAAVYDALIARHGETAERLDARAEVERAKVGKTELMLDLWQRAIELDPNYAKARIHLARLLDQLNGFEMEAQRQLREVLHRDPGNEEARALLKQFQEARRK